jgi:hypothetical protein
VHPAKRGPASGENRSIASPSDSNTSATFRRPLRRKPSLHTTPVLRPAALGHRRHTSTSSAWWCPAVLAANVARVWPPFVAARPWAGGKARGCAREGPALSGPSLAACAGRAASRNAAADHCGAAAAGARREPPDAVVPSSHSTFRARAGPGEQLRMAAGWWRASNAFRGRRGTIHRCVCRHRPLATIAEDRRSHITPPQRGARRTVRIGPLWACLKRQPPHPSPAPPSVVQLPPASRDFRFPLPALRRANFRPLNSRLSTWICFGSHNI